MAHSRRIDVVLFVCCLPFLAADTNKGTNFQDEPCLNMLNDFGNSVASFEECEHRVEHNNFCRSCAPSYWRVTEVYKRIAKLENKTCEKDLAINKDYIQDIKTYQSIQKSWKKAKCDSDNCLKMWNDFENSIVAFEKCEQDAIFPHGNTNVCLQCVSSYLNATEAYNNIIKESPEYEKCESKLANIADFQQDIKEYESIPSLWEKAKCDNFYAIHKKEEYGLEEYAKEIEDAFLFYGTCVSARRNATAKLDVAVCEKCVDAYQTVNDIYTEIEAWYGSVPYKIEFTRDQWYDELGCSKPQKNNSAMAVGMILLSTVVVIGILFLIIFSMICFFIKETSTPLIESDNSPLLVSGNP